MNRIKIDIRDMNDAKAFCEKLSEESEDQFILVNKDGSRDVDLTCLGVTYALSSFDEIYLVNKTNDGIFPEFIK